MSNDEGRWHQLGLPFAHTPHFGTADLLSAASNQAARVWLRRTPEWPQRRLAIWGEAGTGKTHLLHIWARAQGAEIVPGPLLRARPPGASPGFAVDDANAAAEAPLLHLLNAAAETGRPVLLAARPAPARWQISLPDLESRLRATTAVEVLPPDDALLRALLARLLAERQLAVAAAVQDWLLLRLPRTAGAIREVAARLDRASLATGGRVGRALAAAVVAALTDTAPEGDEAQEVTGSLTARRIVEASLAGVPAVQTPLPL